MGRYDALLQKDTHPIPQSPIEPPEGGLSQPPTKESPHTPPLENPPTKHAEPAEERTVRAHEGASVRTGVRVRRMITRYAFEFFLDQLQTLKGFSLEEQIRGEKGSMSQMVRDALDTYIAKRKRTED